jgi:glycosyltransferase involved in cell wall biosynthesis
VRTVGIDWPVSGSSGWGVTGLGMALALAKHPGARPVLTRDPDRASIHPLDLIALDKTRGTKADLMLHGLGHALNPGLPWPSTRGRKRNIAIIACEDTSTPPNVVNRVAHYDAIGTHSTWNSALLRSWGLQNVHVIPQGVDRSHFHPAPRSRPFGDRFVIYSGGKLEYRKGQDLVIAAFKRFKERCPEALLMVSWANQWPSTILEIGTMGHVAGLPDVKDGRLDITGWLVRNGIKAEDVVDLGLVPNWMMPRFIAEADVAVFPSRCEPSTDLPAMEALACEIPTIVSDCTGHMDLTPAAPILLRSQPPARATPTYQATEGWGESCVDEIIEALTDVWQDPTSDVPNWGGIPEWSDSVPVILDMAK